MREGRRNRDRDRGREEGGREQGGRERREKRKLKE